MLEAPQRPDADRGLANGSPNGRGRRVAIVTAIAAVVIAGLIVALVSSGGDPAATSRTTTDAAPMEALPPPTPRRLRVDAAAYEVQLDWQRGSGDGAIERYELSRNGELVTTLNGLDVQYVDDDVMPAMSYLYELEAIGDPPESGSTSAKIRVRTPPAPLGTARLGGVFDVRLKLDSSYGITGLKGGTAGWRFTPSCADGPCGTRLKDLNSMFPATDLKQDGGVYEASGSGHLGLECGGVALTSSYEIRLRVVAAETVGGEWRATKLEGTYSHSSGAQLGCRSGGATYSISARIVDQA